MKSFKSSWGSLEFTEGLGKYFSDSHLNVGEIECLVLCCKRYRQRVLQSKVGERSPNRQG
uniref:Uncharacterized protein n=1 Tax=Arion vulgaris TaxID=1028688 RepID=A0A0B6Y3Z0_9EUPU